MLNRGRPNRRSKVSYELLDCAWHGHFLIGTGAAEVRSSDAILVREHGGLRWHRCLRCDSWIPQPLPTAASVNSIPSRDEIAIPLRGRLLRDRYVLRLISLDRALHCFVLSVLAIAVFVFAANKSLLHKDFVRIVTDLQAGVGGPVRTTHGTVEQELTRLFSVSTRNLQLTGVALTAYAALEGIEAVGLWLAKRWAEYLTFVATAALIPLEIYEIAHKPTALKGLTLAINLAIVVYLMVAKRLFGIRGGHAAEERIREVDSGWPAIEAATPGAGSPQTITAQPTALGHP
ncbi:MAG TPA: DUF2127 domain-containing protein [Acidimicrobiales bacterium]|nr:DUF2127 domain-containing protein [Acidimicrobiales bacterium]